MARALSLLDMPNEILSLICNALRSEDLFAFRSAHRTLAAVGAQHMTRSICIYGTSQSLAAAAAITSHPVLKHHVKRVTIDPFMRDNFDFREPEKEWWEDYHLPNNSSASYYAAAVAAMSEEFSFCEMQSQLFSSGLFSKAMTAILSRLPQLLDIDLHVKHARFRTDRFLKRNNKFFLRHLCAENFDILDNHLPPGCLTEYVPKILDAVITFIGNSPQKRQGRELSLTYAHVPYGFHARYYHSWEQNLPSLSRLSLTWTREYYNRNFFSTAEGADLLRFNILRTFIEFASNLERLDIDLVQELRFSYLFHDDHVWRNLEHLRLGHIACEWKSIEQFFQKHGPQLRSLEFSSLVFSPKEDHEDNEWLTLLDWLRSTSLTALDSFRIEGMFHERGDWGAIKNWTTLYPSFPPPERAIRYLMCGESTDRHDSDEPTIQICEHAYKWDEITWDSIAASVLAWKEDFARRGGRKAYRDDEAKYRDDCFKDGDEVFKMIYGKEDPDEGAWEHDGTISSSHLHSLYGIEPPKNNRVSRCSSVLTDRLSPF